MIKFIDQIAELSGKFAAWMFFAVGIFITYEVFMRYVFIAPTIWVDETARIMQIWAAYLAGAYALKHREMIVIDVAFRDPRTKARKLVESFSLIVILIFCAVAAWYGFELWLKATLRGHTTDSYLGTPKWLTHASIWIGFGLLALQSIAEIIKIWTIGIPDRDALDGAH
ncbi:MAG: TRAP transporter small permease [Devosiaceae bacterium]|nr:TRAP transporter small permease [Devosiaceae bacterium]